MDNDRSLDGGHPLKKAELHAHHSLTHSLGSVPSTNSDVHLTPPPASASHSPIPTMSSLGSPFVAPKRPPRGRTQSIDLQAVLSSGPHEMEAETHILRAVEKMTGQAHRRAGTETARLYATIAEDELTRALGEGELFDAPGKSGMDGSTHRSKNAQAMDGSNRSNAYAPTPQKENGNAAAPKSSPGAGKAKFKQLALESIQARKDENTTVEQTLFGLSNALNKMHKSSRNLNASVTRTFDAPLKSADRLAAAIDEHLQDEMGSLGDVEEGGVKTPSTMYAESEQSFNESDTAGGDGARKNKRTRKSKTQGAQKLVSTAAGGLKDDFEVFNEFLQAKKKGAVYYAKTVTLFIMLPSLLLSALFFYFIEEPNTDPVTGEVVPGQDASIS